MKKRIVWSVAGLVMLATALVSCGNMLAHTGGDPGGGGGSAGNSSGAGARAGGKSLSLVVANYGEHFGNATRAAAGGSLRTIVGDPYDSANVKFWLWGESSTGTVRAPEEVAITPGAGKEGTVNVNLDPGSWNLTLAAVPTTVPDPGDTPNKILENAALAGVAHVDTMHANTVRFMLRSDGLVKPSNVTIEIQANWFDDTKWKATAGIYDLLTGQKIQQAQITDITAQLKNNATYTATDVPPGKYLFKVIFSTPDPNSVEIATWSDVLIVLAAKNETHTVVIPNIMGEKADVPTGFKAGWKQDAPEKRALNSYEVTFNWTRGAKNNETGFELELMDVGDDKTPGNTEARWQALQGTVGQDKITKYDSGVYGHLDKWVDGSLGAGSEEIVLLLPLDRRYLARIRAVNYAGDSDYVYVDLAQQIAGLGQFEGVINVFKVRYGLDGGTWNNGPNAPNTTNDYTEYHKESTQAVTIKKPDGTGADGTLEKGADPWTAWRKSDGTLYDFTAGTNYTDNKSLILTALYGGAASGKFEYEIYNDKDYNIVDAWLTIEATQTGGGAFTVDPQLDFAAGTVGVKRTKGGTDYKVVVKLKLDGTQWNYDWVNLKVTAFGRTPFEMTKPAAAVGADNTFEVDVSNWNPGIYQCLLMAGKGRTIVSKPLTLTLADN